MEPSIRCWSLCRCGAHRLPSPVRAFFKGTEYLTTIRHFFGPATMAARVLPLVLGLVAGWHLARYRIWLLVPVICAAVGLVMTLTYIYPINDVLFFQAGGDLAPEAVRKLVRQWVVADRIRFGVMAAGYVALLRALSIPFPTDTRS